MLVERDNKIAEFDVHLRKKDERCAIMETELRQRVQGKHLNCFLSLHPSVDAASSKKKFYSSGDVSIVSEKPITCGIISYPFVQILPHEHSIDG